MSKQRKTYTQEFKLETIRLAETSGQPIMQEVADRFARKAKRANMD